MRDEPDSLEDEDGEAGVIEPMVRKAPPRKLTYIEGDELYAEVSAVADALFARGAEEAGNAALDWLFETEFR